MTFAPGGTAMTVLSKAMASRRLNSDRHFTADFNTEMYTRVGMDWGQNTTMADVLLRHYPELRVATRGITNAFQPWTVVTSE